MVTGEEVIVAAPSSKPMTKRRLSQFLLRSLFFHAQVLIASSTPELIDTSDTFTR
jgi:hypothetical protein